MDNFKYIYKILASLEKAMDYPRFDMSQICAEALGVSEERWKRYLEMLVDAGYIKGVRISSDMLGETIVRATDIKITLKGLEYLQENSLMKKVCSAAKGIADIIT